MTTQKPPIILNAPFARSIAQAILLYSEEYGSANAEPDLNNALAELGVPLKIWPHKATSLAPSLGEIPAPKDRLSEANLPQTPAGDALYDGSPSPPPPVDWTPSQAEALPKLRSWIEKVKTQGKSLSDELPFSRFFLLRGYAGTGKSFLLKYVLDEFGSSVNLLFSAPTHQAAKVLTGYIGRPATTVASRLGVKAVVHEDSMEFQLPERLPHIPIGSILVVDESSMLSKDYVKFFVMMAERLGVFILFVGDPLQLPPVGEKRSSVWSLVKDNEYRHTLTDVKRTAKPALLDFLMDIRGQIVNRTYENNLSSFATDGEIVQVSSQKALLRQIKARLEEFESGSAKVVAWRNKKVDYYAACVRELLGLSGTVCRGDRLRLSGSFLPFESIQIGEVGVTTEEVKVGKVEHSTLTPNFFGQIWPHVDIPVLVAELEGQTFDLHAVAIPDPDLNGPAMLQGLLNKIAIAARAEKGMKAKEIWSHFWETKSRFIQPKSAYANTAHTFQGSQAATVVMDSVDILSNPTKAEAFRCWYVAASRSTNLLISN